MLHLRAQSAASLNANFRIIQPRLLQHQTPIPVSNNKGSGNFLIKSSQTKPSLGLTNGKITA
ncbi:MAG: hypothetical protein CVU09_06225 [Bacteroidetes bacterium HGW-Bacteroidetes-4]|nr:MAG: hypothetical protein CVU09_06225 [Bacteroidetes bacterium HGW-Bacteroidetes-4]